MDRTEKLRLSADNTYCHAFKHGMFSRLLEHNLYWFSHTIKPLKPMLERVKGGEPVVYGGLPISSFEKLVEDGALLQVETTEYGWKWPYAGQKALPEGMPEFAAWREAALAVAVKVPAALAHGGKDILAEVAAFNLAALTPMQAMNAIAEWQEATGWQQWFERDGAH